MTTGRNIKMGVTHYETIVDMHDAIRVRADFVVYVSGRSDAELIAEAQRRIALYLCSGDICIVKATDKPRCFYCGTLAADAEAVKCESCGASL